MLRGVPSIQSCSSAWTTAATRCAHARQAACLHGGCARNPAAAKARLRASRLLARAGIHLLPACVCSCCCQVRVAACAALALFVAAAGPSYCATNSGYLAAGVVLHMDDPDADVAEAACQVRRAWLRGIRLCCLAALLVGARGHLRCPNAAAAALHALPGARGARSHPPGRRGGRGAQGAGPLPRTTLLRTRAGGGGGCWGWRRRPQRRELTAVAGRVQVTGIQWCHRRCIPVFQAATNPVAVVTHNDHAPRGPLSSKRRPSHTSMHAPSHTSPAAPQHTGHAGCLVLRHRSATACKSCATARQGVSSSAPAARHACRHHPKTGGAADAVPAPVDACVSHALCMYVTKRHHQLGGANSPQHTAPWELHGQSC